MFIVVTYPCGCSPWSDKHDNPNCPIVKERQKEDTKTKELLEEFKKRITQ